MSQNKAVQALVDKLVTIAKSYDFPNEQTLIKSVDMLSKITHGESFSSALKKDLIIQNMETIRAHMDSFHLGDDVKEFVLACKKAEALVKQYHEETNMRNEKERDDRKRMHSVFPEEEEFLELGEDPYDARNEEFSDFEQEDRGRGRKKKKSGGAFFLFIVLLFVVGGGGFAFFYVNTLFEEVQAERNGDNNKEVQRISVSEQDSKTSTQQTKTNGDRISVKNNVSAQFGEATPPPPPEDYQVKETVQSAYGAVPPPYSKAEPSLGAVCKLLPKYHGDKDEFIYYIRNSQGSFVPVYQDKHWDGKGVGLKLKTVALSVDKESKLVEVERGKYLPMELFASCSFFNK